MVSSTSIRIASCSSMRHGVRRTWRGHAVELPKVSACERVFRMGIGKQQHLWLACGSMAWLRRLCSMDQSTARRFKPT